MTSRGTSSKAPILTSFLLLALCSSLVLTQTTPSSDTAKISECYTKLLENLHPIKNTNTTQIGGMPLIESSQAIARLNGVIAEADAACKDVSRPKLIDFLNKYLHDDQLLPCVKSAFDYIRSSKGYQPNSSGAKYDSKLVITTIKLLNFIDDVTQHCRPFY